MRVSTCPVADCLGLQKTVRWQRVNVGDESYKNVVYVMYMKMGTASLVHDYSRVHLCKYSRRFVNVVARKLRTHGRFW